MNEHDVALEQAYLDRAHDLLLAMEARTRDAAAALEVEARGGDVAAAQAKAMLDARLRTLRAGEANLCFGRIDESGPAGATYYVGRRHVEDDRADPVVVDWRAPVAAAFYRATPADPFDLHRRRRFSLEGRSLMGLFDEVFDDPDHPEAALGGGVPDPLLAELERSRAGELRDIVATIQAEQDVIIRAGLDRAVLVQGGPGTGKTAVGLHRAAFLLYEHRRRALDKRILVVGPNRLFLRYIGEVLPSLGETAVTQHTIETLAGSRYRVRARDTSAVEALKGDVRMAAVLAQGLWDLCGPVADAVVATTYGPAKLPAGVLASLREEASTSTSSFSAGREVFRRLVERNVYAQFFDRHSGSGPDEGSFLSALKADRAFQAVVTKLWPSASAPALVRRLLGSPSALRAAADGILNADEQRRLRRPSTRKVDDELWTLSDLPLLDEAEGLINGHPVTYLHAVVDEAQDLSAMALRMVARRVPSGSLTVLGDLAQATGPASSRSWDEVARHLGADEVDRCELSTGYRLPSEILDWANRLLPEAAPGVRPAASVRVGGSPPSIVRSDDPVADATDSVVRLSGEHGLVGVIAAPSMAAEVRASLLDAGLDVGPLDPSRLDHAVNVLGAVAAKGLEFDATVVVEPALVVDEEAGGLRALYVALTRCVQHLTVVHRRDLPDALR